MAKLINQTENGVIFIENENGVFGIVSSSIITDEDGLLCEQDTLTTLERNGFELDQNWDSNETTLKLGGGKRVVFSGAFAELA